MNKMAKRTAAIVAAGVMLLNTVLPVLAADTSIVISGNGAQANDTANVSVSSDTQVTQSNTADVTNNIKTDSQTGDNSISGTTGGSSSIDTGTSSTQVDVKNAVNSNVADVNGCCTGDTSVSIKDNGAQSNNTANTGISNETTLWQTNAANVANNVSTNNETGDNTIKNTTNGSASISTGDTNTDVHVSTLANANEAQIGGNGGSGSFSAEILGNGALSHNTINTDLSSETTLGQINHANISNDVNTDSQTGDNEISGNTGGAVGILTGDANTTVGVDNMVNFNSANIDCGECLTDVLAKIAGNGFDSKNTINADLSGEKLATQQNNWSCGLHEILLDSFVQDGNGKGCNKVTTNSETGDNSVKNSTLFDPGFDPLVNTGDTNTDTTVTNTGNSNVMGQPFESNQLLQELSGLSFSFNLNDLFGSLHLI